MLRNNVIFSIFRRIVVFISVFFLFVVTGCTYQGGEVNPIERKFSWFSFLNGDDMRATCQSGGPNHYRFVYNGVYTEQVRIYELRGNDLKVEVIGEADLSELYVNEVLDLLKPWQGKKATIRLREADKELLEQAMTSDGIFTHDEREIELSSDQFYWLVVACKEGVLRFGTFRWPDANYKNLAFSPLLLGWDMTEIPLNPPRETLFDDEYKVNKADHGRFNIRVGPNGLMYLLD
ncbi:MAG: hypothetical protein OQJ97_02995 [Rhodospirillales bacterium]|nr:hypothetical protein [Rhodospirillales bacterium]